MVLDQEGDGEAGRSVGPSHAVNQNLSSRSHYVGDLEFLVDEIDAFVEVCPELSVFGVLNGCILGMQDEFFGMLGGVTLRHAENSPDLKRCLTHCLHCMTILLVAASTLPM